MFFFPGKSFAGATLNALCQYSEHRPTVFGARAHVRDRGGLCDQTVERVCFGIFRYPWIGQYAFGVTDQQRPRRHGAECKSRYACMIDPAAEIHGGQVDTAAPCHSSKGGAERLFGKRDAHRRSDFTRRKGGAAVTLDE